MPWTDCHAHPTDDRFGGDGWADAWQRAIMAGVHRVLCGGYNPEDWERQHRIHAQDPRIVPCYGLHPYFVAASSRETCEQALEQLEILRDRYCLMGELGIDKRPEFAKALEQQIHFLERQLDLAIRLCKVPVYHIVHGHNEVQPLLKARAGRLLGGIVHAFSGNMQIAQFYLEHGCSLSIGPQLLSPQASKLRQVVRDLPLDRLLIESDAPDGRPLGKGLGEPGVIIEMAKAVCAIKGVSLQAFAEVLEKHVCSILERCGHAQGLGKP